MQGKKHTNGIIRLSRLGNMTSIYGKEIFNRKKGQVDEYKLISFLYSIIINKANFNDKINIQIRTI